MSDLICPVCSEPWDAWGLHHGDMMAWEARLFKAGAGCPSCEGISPEGDTDAEADARQLAGVESMASNWDDPDSFPAVLDTFAEAAGAPRPKRKPWAAPNPKVLWKCEGCEVETIEALQLSLCEPNAPDQAFAWRGGKRVHYVRGAGFTYGEFSAHEDPQREPFFTIDGKPYCPGCAQVCDGAGCVASIFQRSELQGDAYDAGSSFMLEGEYHDAYCLECYERLSEEQRAEQRASDRRDIARNAGNMRDNGSANEAVRQYIAQALRSVE